MRGLLGVLLGIGVASSLVAGAPRAADIERLRELHRRSQPDSVRALASQWISSEPYSLAGTPRLELLSAWGQTEASFGRGRVAEPLLKEALRLARTMGDSLTAGRLLRWVGVSVGLQGRIAEADSIYDDLLTAARRLGDRELEGWAHVGSGWCALQRGQLERCVIENRQARTLHASVHNALGYSWAMNSEAIALRRLGRFAEARELYDETIAASRNMPGADMLHAMALANRGELDMLLGDPQRALLAFRRAEFLHLQRRHEREAAAVTLNRCFALLEQAHEREAIAALDSLRSHCREHGWVDLEAHASNELARAHWAAGHPRWALESFRQTRRRADLPMQSRTNAEMGERAVLFEIGRPEDVIAQLDDELPPVEAPEMRMVRRIARGRALRLLGRAEQSWKTLATACEEDSLRLLLTASRIDLLTEAGLSARAAGLDSESRILLERAASAWEEYRATPTDPRWREQRATRAARIFPALALAACSPHTTEAAADSIFQRVQRAKARTLLDRVAGPASAEFVAHTAPFGDVLAPTEVFLDLYLSDDAGVLFLVTSSEVRAREVDGAKAWRARLQRLRRLALDSPTRESVREHLLEKLLGVWAEEVGRAETVLWSGDGPFLPAAGEMAPTWTLVPSWSLLTRLRPSTSIPRGGVTPHLVSHPDAPAFPEAKREIEWLARRFRTVDVDGPGLWPDSSAVALHFAGHVSARLDAPWTTDLVVVRPDASTTTDWPAWKIASASGAPPLVVLSGCSTISGREIAGEGLSGLATAFLCAGSRCVVATRWPVQDRFARRFVQTLYEELDRGLSVDRALRLAQRRHRGQDDQPQAFVILGDPSLRLRIDHRR